MRTPFFFPLALAATALGCGSPSRSESQYWDPVAVPTLQSGPSPEGGPAEAGPTPEAGPPTGTVTFTATPVSYGGRYSPRDVGAIWVEDPSGTFVKTLLRWGYLRYVNLSKYRADTGLNSVDAITAATARVPEPHSGTWNYTDVSGNVVPDGDYQFLVEFAEDDAYYSSSTNGPWTAVPFKKGAGASDFNPPDVSGFKDMSVTYQAP